MKFRTVQELEQSIEEYFEGLGIERPTLTGLCLHLGFCSRQSFYDYEKIKKYSYTIKRARMSIENIYEQQLFEKNSTGAIFALKNFGWRDRQELEHTTKDKNGDSTGIKISFGE